MKNRHKSVNQQTKNTGSSRLRQAHGQLYNNNKPQTKQSKIAPEVFSDIALEPLNVDIHVHKHRMRAGNPQSKLPSLMAHKQGTKSKNPTSI